MCIVDIVRGCRPVRTLLLLLPHQLQLLLQMRDVMLLGVCGAVG